MKVFLGMRDVASNLGGIRAGLLALGHTTHTMLLRKDQITESHDDGAISLEDAVKEFDLFWFKWTTFDKEALGRDLKIIKGAGKKIVVQFCGSDIRRSNWFAAAQAAGLPSVEYGLDPEMDARKINYVRNVERYADLIIGFQEPGLSIRRPFAPEPFFFLDLAKYDPDCTQREEPVLLHAPSKRAYKGTDQILAVLDRLKRCKVVLVENMPHAEAIEQYRKADVVVGEIYGQGGGSLAREAMALGKVVATACSPGYYTGIFCGPMVHIDPYNLENILQGLIDNHPWRSRLAKAGPLYAAHFCDAKRNVEMVLDHLTRKHQLPLFDHRKGAYV